MESVRLAILGAGSVRHGIPVFASLATYFGERPLDITLYDADEERLDLFDAFARCAFAFNKNRHRLRASTDAREMLDGADRVVLQIDENCARKEAKAAGFKSGPSSANAIEDSLGRLLNNLPNQIQVMSLEEAEVHIPLDYYYRLEWPDEPSVEEIRGIPHQVLRWLRGEEYLHEEFRRHASSPLKAWLDDVSTATIVSAI